MDSNFLTVKEFAERAGVSTQAQQHITAGQETTVEAETVQAEPERKRGLSLPPVRRLTLFFYRPKKTLSKTIV